MPRLRQLRVKESKYIIYKKEFILLQFVADILQSTYFTGFDYNHHVQKFHFWKSDDETEWVQNSDSSKLERLLML